MTEEDQEQLRAFNLLEDAKSRLQESAPKSACVKGCHDMYSSLFSDKGSCARMCLISVSYSGYVTNEHVFNKLWWPSRSQMHRPHAPNQQ